MKPRKFLTYTQLAKFNSYLKLYYQTSVYTSVLIIPILIDNISHIRILTHCNRENIFFFYFSERSIAFINLTVIIKILRPKKISVTISVKLTMKTSK